LHHFLHSSATKIEISINLIQSFLNKKNRIGFYYISTADSCTFGTFMELHGGSSNWESIVLTTFFHNIYLYLRIENAEGYVLIAVYLFLMRVIRLTQKVLNRIA